ncbi:MAG: aminopeptidase P family protein [Spirochaetes bacterium]|nr:aminopeptidase P family protein [Spirochaetota bacterium]
MRLKILHKILKDSGQFPYVVFNLKNIRYLTGFTGSNAYLIIDENANYFITDSRYEIFARTLLNDDYRFIIQKKGFKDVFEQFIKENKIQKIFLEPSELKIDVFNTLKNAVPETELIPASDYISEMRAVKTSDEIKIIQEAVNIADSCIDHILKIFNPEMTEWQLSAEIDSFYRKNNCRRTSFDSIVASGPGSAMPHYVPSFEKKIGTDTLLMIDMGCEYLDYCSDITRTFFIGNVPEKFMEIYNIVLEAQNYAIEMVKPGVKCCDIDAAARTHIEKRGYGNFFGHSLGHGVGLDVHENPYVKSDNSELLKSGSIITIEPGIYIEGEGGIRIEDMICVTDEGYMNMTGSSKEIIIL